KFGGGGVLAGESGVEPMCERRIAEVPIARHDCHPPGAGVRSWGPLAFTSYHGRLRRTQIDAERAKSEVARKIVREENRALSAQSDHRGASRYEASRAIATRGN